MKKIMFNDRYGLTKAVLNGTKTQTRRLVPAAILSAAEEFSVEYFNGTFDVLKDVELIDHFCLTEKIKHPHFLPNEVVAVAQSYKNIDKEYSSNFECQLIKKGQIVDTNEAIANLEVGTWCSNENNLKICKACEKKNDCFEKYFRFIGMPSFTNKMFVKAELMPHQIRITDIHVEHLQDISDEDCIKEGIYSFIHDTGTGKCSVYGFDHGGVFCDTPKAAYAELIDKISGKGTWKSNPFVFVYDFELVK